MKKARGDVLAVLLEDGESVAEGIASACSETGTDSALITSGIGMLRECNIGYWNGREYETKTFSEPLELVSMSGSLAAMDGKPSVHLHVSLAGRDHRVLGGHLVSAIVNNINEISVVPFPMGSFGRKYSEKTRLNMLKFGD